MEGGAEVLLLVCGLGGGGGSVGGFTAGLLELLLDCVPELGGGGGTVGGFTGGLLTLFPDCVPLVGGGGAVGGLTVELLLVWELGLVLLEVPNLLKSIDLFKIKSMGSAHFMLLMTNVLASDEDRLIMYLPVVVIWLTKLAGLFASTGRKPLIFKPGNEGYP